MQDFRTLNLTIIELENLSLFKSIFMTNYFNKVQIFRQDILDFENSYIENQLKFEIFRELIAQYDSFVDHFYFV